MLLKWLVCCDADRNSRLDPAWEARCLDYAVTKSRMVHQPARRLRHSHIRGMIFPEGHEEYLPTETKTTPFLSIHDQLELT